MEMKCPNRTEILPCRKQVMQSVFKTMALLIAIFAFRPVPCIGQEDSLKTYRNTIRINLTNPMIFGWRNNVFGYERVLKDYQTASLSIGRFGFPKLERFDSDSARVINQNHDHGYHFSIDYRFYVRKENKYQEPRGIYIGPYYAFNYFSRDITWDLNTISRNGEVKSYIDLAANLIGLQLGYQFIFWDRLSIDIILMGPGVWFFNLKTDFDTALSQDDESMLIDNLNEMLKDKFPESDLMIHGGDFQAKKATRTAVIGFRYVVNAGFRF
jgi:hypothetical protein